MLRQPLFVPFFIVLVALAAIHHTAVFFSWYFFFWWIDVVTHFLGGLVVGLAALWVLHLVMTRYKRRQPSVYAALAVVVGIVMLVGVGWEFFEYFSGTFIDENLFPDTAHDLFADFAGGLVAYWYALRREFVGALDTPDNVSHAL